MNQLSPFPLSNWSDEQLALLEWITVDLEQWRMGGYEDQPQAQELKEEVEAETQRRNAVKIARERP